MFRKHLNFSCGSENTCPPPSECLFHRRLNLVAAAELTALQRDRERFRSQISCRALGLSGTGIGYSSTVLCDNTLMKTMMTMCEEAACWPPLTGFVPRCEMFQQQVFFFFVFFWAAVNVSDQWNNENVTTVRLCDHSRNASQQRNKKSTSSFDNVCVVGGDESWLVEHVFSVVEGYWIMWRTNSRFRLRVSSVTGPDQ